MAVFVSAIQGWFAAEPQPVEQILNVPGSGSTHLLAYDVATQGVSLHVPLHRALGGILAELGKRWGLTMPKLLDLEKKNASQLLHIVSALLEGPLRAQVR